MRKLALTREAVGGVAAVGAVLGAYMMWKRLEEKTLRDAREKQHLRTHAAKKDQEAVSAQNEGRAAKEALRRVEQARSKLQSELDQARAKNAAQEVTHEAVATRKPTA